jgi:penicillin-binding protein 2
MVANKGEHLIPRLLRGKIQDGVFEEALIAHREKLTLSDSSNWEVITKGMRNVNMSPKGTAHRAFKDAPYSSAGKTGTAQVRSLGQEEEYNAEDIAERYRDNAMYVGYAPAEDPEVVVVVAIENSLGGGGSVAAPVARKILDVWHTRFNNGKKQQEETNADN